jgi:hypothetical protein
MQTLLDRRAAAQPAGSANSTDTCRCGQPLELCSTSYCPRCGTALHAH